MYSGRINDFILCIHIVTMCFTVITVLMNSLWLDYFKDHQGRISHSMIIAASLNCSWMLSYATCPSPRLSDTDDLSCAPCVLPRFPMYFGVAKPSLMHNGLKPPLISSRQNAKACVQHLLSLRTRPT